MFNYRATNYITKVVRDLNEGTYTLVTMPSIDTTNRLTRALGYRKRTLKCNTRTTLNISNV